jgi:hypothetical protein
MIINMIQYNNINVKMKKIILLFVLLPLFIGCQGLFDPEIENFKNDESLIKEPRLAQQNLGHAYLSHPLRGWSFNDVATDDAVSNDPVNNYMRIATGQWRAYNSPMNGNWQTRRSAIQYLNNFISYFEDVQWSADGKINDMFNDRMKGDAYGMRALFMYHLLLEHAGWTESGELLGIPILTEPETVDSYFNFPRNTFKECIAQIFSDVQVAIENLPLFYVPDPFPSDNVPLKYKMFGVTGADYERVFGSRYAGGRMNGAIAEAILAQAYLLAASPAYSAGSGITWEQAAIRMATVLGRLGVNPIAQIDPTGHKWYETVPAGAGANPKEILWRGDKERNHTLEGDHFPPTVFGNGRLNPTQNLVDAFPMANGYPATEGNGYNPNAPYSSRDPRLDLYIIRNGSTAGANNVVINTAEDGPNENALNRETGKSTRTGYYMKKHLIQSVRDNTSPNWNDQEHYKAYIRYTEIFLGYAEAANEAWGPQGKGTYSYSAYDVVKAIRARAGISGGDAYLESIKGDKDAMREMIRNERRLELCFEGHRFWDLRRWNVSMAKLTEPAKGMQIKGGIYSPIPVVEERAYSDYMYHAPIPYSEILKFDALVQNRGWK